MIPARTCLRAVLAAVLVLAFTVIVPRAASADVGETIDVTITSHSAPVLDLSDPDQAVELSGTIINTSPTRVRFMSVNFWQSSEPITSRSALDAAVASPAMQPLGERTPPYSEESGHVHVITRDDWFEPGARARFTVRATVGELNLPDDDAVYLLGVHVRGITEDGTGTATVGRGRILTLATSQNVDVATVVTLTAPPTQLATGRFVDDTLLGELEGRLETLLTAAERPGATVLVDPSLLAEVEALAEPHVVAGEESPGHEIAADWAGRVRSLIADGRALRLPYADAALARGVAEARLDSLVEWTEGAVATDEEVADLPLAVDLGNAADAEVVDELLAAGVQTVLADNISDGGAGVIPAAPLVQTGIGPGGRDTQVQQANRRLAEEFLAESPRVYVLRTPDDVDRFGDVDHRRLVELPVISGAPVLEPGDPQPTPWATLAEQLDALWAQSGFLLDLTGTDVSDDTQLLSAKASSRHFDDEAAALAFVDAHPAAGIDATDVSVTTARQFVMGSRTNDFPMTITNALPVPVTVRLVFDSDSPQRIHVPPTEFVTVSPGENLAVSVAPQAASNGVVAVRAQLETRGGERFGPEVPIEITATDLGRVGWIIIVISGAVVLGGTFLRIRAVRAENAKESSEQGQ